MYNLHILKIISLCTEWLYLTLTSLEKENITNYLWNYICETMHIDPPSVSIFNFWCVKYYFMIYSMLFMYKGSEERELSSWWLYLESSIAYIV